MSHRSDWRALHGLAGADQGLANAKEHHRSSVEAIATRQGTRAEHLARR